MNSSNSNDQKRFVRTATFVGATGLLVALADPLSGIGKLPLRFILKERLGLAPQALALFMFVASIPMYVKPLTGLLSDAFPLFGSRRRSYFLLGALLAMLATLALILFPLRYAVLLIGAFLILLMLTVVTTTAGAIQVEQGQALEATGRLAAIRSIMLNTGSVPASALGGYLVSQSFGLTCGLLAAGFLLLVPVGLKLLDEPRNEGGREISGAPLASLQERLKALRSARALWIATAIMIGIALAPGLGVTLFFFQTDVNHFSPILIGWLGTASVAAKVLVALLYLPLCRRIPMGILLKGAILLSAMAPLGYLWYHTPTQAFVVDSIYWMVYELTTIVLFDLAARTTPKGSEGFVFGLLISTMTIASNGSDWFGAFLYGSLKVPFTRLCMVNAGLTLPTILLVSLLPKALLSQRESVPMAEDESAAETAATALETA